MKCPHCEKEILPEKVSVFDPIIGAFREITREQAEQTLKYAKELENQLAPDKEKEQ